MDWQTPKKQRKDGAASLSPAGSTPSPAAAQGPQVQGHASQWAAGLPQEAGGSNAAAAGRGGATVTGRHAPQNDTRYEPHRRTAEAFASSCQHELHVLMLIKHFVSRAVILIPPATHVCLRVFSEPSLPLVLALPCKQMPPRLSGSCACVRPVPAARAGRAAATAAGRSARPRRRSAR